MSEHDGDSGDVDLAQTEREGARRADDAAFDVTLGDPASPARASGPTKPGGRIGRFVVLETLGEGAMGIVLAAYDADLDRKVAIKLLRSAAAGHAASTLGTDRLLREARAMAKLSHPNVLAVHEVGTVDDQVFVAMEFAAGGTLRDWCTAAPRSWREVLDRFVPAGRGLGAAHEAGLVHRDFKPENVLLTARGDVCVADFGLVGIHGRETKRGADVVQQIGEDADPAVSLDVTLTRTGTLLGTPAYMAPEQHEREAAGPAADQFAFCVSLWEALHGARPFAGRSYWELARNVIDGKFAELPADREVPPWLQRVVRRGLGATPADRWPSMGALVAALEHDPTVVRRQRVRRGALIAGIVALAGLAVFGLSRRATVTPRCQGMGDRLAGVWDPDRAAAVRAAFDASGRTYAADTFDRVRARLETYTGDWVIARVEACKATHVRGDQSEALLDRRMACLDQRLAAVGALVDLFARKGDPGVLDNSVEAAAKLPTLGGCADTEALQAIVPRPDDPDVRAAVDEQRRALAAVKALEDAGQYAEAVIAAQAVTTEADRLGHAPLLAEALFRRASVEEKTGNAKTAEVTLGLALPQAADAHDDVLAARIWAELVFVVGYRLGRHDEALRLRPGAEAALRRAGVDPEIEARLLNNLGTVFYGQGQYEQSRELVERALVIRERVLGPDHHDVASSLNNVGNALKALARYDEARSYLDRARTTFVKVLGAEHPMVALALNNLGNLAMSQGSYDEARRSYEEALTIRENALGPGHRNVADSLNGLGQVLEAQGSYDEAQRHFERGLAIRVALVGPDHPEVAVFWNNLGEVAQHQGDHEVAQDHLEQALAIWTRAGHSSAGIALVNLGDVAEALGKHDEALGHYDRSLAIAIETFGEDHPRVADACTGLADALLSLGRSSDALAAAERAVRIREARRVPPEVLAHSRFSLARAVWAVGRERPRALALAEAARDALAGAGAAGSRRLPEVEAWLRAH